MPGRALLATLLLGLLPALVVACAPAPIDPERAARLCEEQARAARGPTGEVSVGASSGDGPFLGAALTISSDYLAGRDPLDVYEDCVIRRTGAAPIRPPAL